MKNFTKIIICLMAGYLISSAFTERAYPEKPTVTYMDSTDYSVLTKHSLMVEINKQGIKCADFVYKQSILETGNLTSEICKTKHNLFGFFYAGSYMTFKDWKASVAYYRNWQKKRYKGGDYASFIVNTGYATDSTYIQKVLQIQNYKNETDEVSEAKLY